MRVSIFRGIGALIVRTGVACRVWCVCTGTIYGNTVHDDSNLHRNPLINHVTLRYLIIVYSPKW